MTVPVDGIPLKVRIGPHTMHVAELHPEDREDNYGAFIESDLEISIRKEYASGSVAVDSVIHEILHAIWFVGSVNAEQGEEHIVSLLATHLTQVIRDNPGLIVWMQDTVSK